MKQKILEALKTKFSGIDDKKKKLKNSFLNLKGLPIR